MAVEKIERDDPVADVRAAITSIQKGAGEPAASPPPGDDSLAPSRQSPESDPEAVLDTIAEGERSRDPETGRFLPKEEGDKVKPTELKATTDAPKATLDQQPQPAGKPPPGWSPEAKAEWAKLSPVLQQAVIKREDEVSSGFKAKSDELRRWQELEGIIAPRRAYYQRFGFQNDVQAINHLLTISDSLERDATGTLAFLAKHYGVDPSRLTGAPQQGQPLTQPQPQQPIPQQVEEAVGMYVARMQLEEFEKSPPEHYSEVKPMMGVLLQSGAVKDLQDAYDQAIWANPQFRQGRLEAQKTEQEAKRQETQKADLERKKRATNASITGAPHGTPTRQKSEASKGSFGEVADDVRAAITQLR